MVIHNLDVVGVPVPPDKVDPPLVVDPDAVLTGPVSFQRFEPVAADLRQVFETGRCVETREPGASRCFDALKAPAGEPFVKSPCFLAPKREDHPNSLVRDT